MLTPQIKRHGSWDHPVSGSDPTGRLVNFAGLGSKFLTDPFFEAGRKFQKRSRFLNFQVRASDSGNDEV